MRLITGMHRSGTSLVARLFYEVGADMGNPEQFYRPDKWNPDGYFEQPDIHAINMPLINGPWWKFAYFWLPSAKTILKRADKRAMQIQQTALRYQNSVVKETRFCLTLPAWLKYGASIDKIVVCLRDPIQVVQSLQKRNHVTSGHALHLWYIHNSRLIEQADDIPLWFIYYENLLDPRVFHDEIHYAFRFFGYAASSEKIAALREKCVKAQMNHHSRKLMSYPSHIDRLWKELRKRHAEQFENL